MTSKGQITVPKAVRVHLNLKPGDRVLFTISDAGGVHMLSANKDVSSLRGILPPPSRQVSIDEIEASIARAASARALGHDRD